MSVSPAMRVSAVATTRRFALSAGEWATTAIAASVSTGAYLSAGYPYLARGVVGDLLGFGVLAGLGVAVRARVKHEAAICLALIGLVVVASPQWPLALPEPAWWALFLLGLAMYIAVRRRLCD
jgi:uncharacterized membrane protein